MIGKRSNEKESGSVAEKRIEDYAESVTEVGRAQMGPDYAVTIEGLNMPVLWTRAGPSEVMLYVPYKLAIVPKP